MFLTFTPFPQVTLISLGSLGYFCVCAFLDHQSSFTPTLAIIRDISWPVPYKDCLHQPVQGGEDPFALCRAERREVEE